MKKIYTLFLIAVLAMNGLMAQTYSGGAGTEADPWQISTVQDLLDLDTADLQWDTVSYYIVTENIDMADTSISPIGYGGVTFSGVFDGNNKVISNVTVTNMDPSIVAYNQWGGIGVFGKIDGTIKNLGIDGLTYDILTGGAGRNDVVGALVGNLVGSGVVENCFVINADAVPSGWLGGGLVCSASSDESTTVSNCFSDAKVTATWGAGIVNDRKGGMILDSCVFYGTSKGDAMFSVNGKGYANIDSASLYYISTTGAANTQLKSTELSPAQMVEQANYPGLGFTSRWKMLENGFAVLASFPDAAYVNMEGIQLPVADAGDDKIVFGNEMDSLDATGSTNSFDTIFYSWTSLDGIELDDSTKAKPKFTAPDIAEETIYKFKLVVYDSAYGVNGLVTSAPDTVAITVKKAAVADKLDPATWTATAQHTGEDNTVEEVFDGDITSTWYSDWKLADASFPIWYMIDLNKTADIVQFIYYSRQDNYGPNGTIAGYELYVSDNKNDFGTAVASGTFDWPEPIYGSNGKATNLDDYKDPQSVELDAAATGRYVKLVATSQIGNIAPNAAGPQMGIAELHLFGVYLDNTPPIAIAGDDQTVQIDDVVQLSGDVDDPDVDDVITYAWTMSQAATDAGITLNDAAIAGPTFTAPSVTADTDFEIILVVNDGTVDSSADTVVITVEADAETSISLAKAMDVSVYPNPSNGVFTVVSKASAELVVTDLVGRVVLSDVLFEGENSVDLSAYNKGIYLLTVKEGQKRSTIKLQVK